MFLIIEFVSVESSSSSSYCSMMMAWEAKLLCLDIVLAMHGGHSLVTATGHCVSGQSYDVLRSEVWWALTVIIVSNSSMMSSTGHACPLPAPGLSSLGLVTPSSSLLTHHTQSIP